MFGGFPFGSGYFGDSLTTTGTVVPVVPVVATHSSGRIQRRKPESELILVLSAKASLHYQLSGTALTRLIAPYTATTATSYRFGGHSSSSHPVINVAAVAAKMKITASFGHSMVVAPRGLKPKKDSLLTAELSETVNSEDDLVALLVALDEL